MPAQELLIGDLIYKNAAAVPDRVAAWLDGEQLTHRELEEQGDRLAWALRDLGIRRGDRVVSWSDTSLDVLPLFVATSKLGAVFAPLNARLGQPEALEVIEMAQARLLVCDTTHSEDGARIRSNLEIPYFACFRESTPGEFDLRLDPKLHASRESRLQEPDLCEADPHVIFFTSGSTGKPKGVILSHRANYLRSHQGIFLDGAERSVCMFPLFHMAAFTLALAAWQTQGEIAFVREASASAILEAAVARRANRLYCIPAVWSRILAEDLKQFDLSSLRYIDTGTSATPIELLQALHNAFPNSLLRVYYGSTEAGAGTTLNNVDALEKPGSVGLPSPGVELRIDETGEICLRAPWLMDGYFNNPEATDAALRDGWFHTGDLGSLDASGYLSIVGRIKEIIRTGGESVAPAEVEALLAQHPGVAEIAVVGIPSPEWGEVVCAVVVPAQGASLSLSDLQKFCEGKLAAFKKPRRMETMSVFPRTAATGQVQRALLVEQILASGE